MRTGSGKRSACRVRRQRRASLPEVASITSRARLLELGGGGTQRQPALAGGQARGPGRPPWPAAGSGTSSVDSKS